LAASRRIAAEHTAAARAAVAGLPGDSGFLDALIATMASRAK
jgi:hypothetical protein